MTWTARCLHVLRVEAAEHCFRLALWFAAPMADTPDGRRIVVAVRDYFSAVCRDLGKPGPTDDARKND